MERSLPLDRPPLPAEELRRRLAEDGIQLRVVPEAASTNAELLGAAREGAPEGLVLVAEQQTAGRGRQGRAWTSPPRAGLTFSVLLRPRLPTGWLSLLTGLAVADVLADLARVPVGLKWPNDVLISVPGGPVESDHPDAGQGQERKVAGVLAEVAPSNGWAVVVGVGLNVTTRADELPPPSRGMAPTSLALAGAAELDRAVLLEALVHALMDRYHSWRADPRSLLEAYRARCRTLGRRVRLELPNGQLVVGTAEDVDAAGRLVVDAQPYSAADVSHLR